MISTVGTLVRLRGLLLWGVVSAGAGGIGSVAASALTDPRRSAGAIAGFTGLLVTGCAAATLLAAGWLWVITTDVVVRVLVAGHRPPGRRPGAVRMLLLTACGVVALEAAANPACADDRPPVGEHSLAGLPLPDRATSGEQRTSREEPDPASRVGTDPEIVTVRPGDSLWAISEERLGPGATTADLVAFWHRIYQLSAAVIGPDPDLILPGQRLSLPPIDLPAPSAKSTRGGTR